MPVGISVLMPVYNGSLFLDDTLKSLLNQTSKDFEVICIDDSSLDNSLEILKKYAEKDKRIKVFSKTNEGSASKAVNFGLKFAQGEYLMYTSQDDLFSNNLLKVNYNTAKKENADIVVPNMVFYYPNNKNKTGLYGLLGSYDKTITGEEAFSLSLNWQIHGFILFKRNLLDNFGSKFFDFNINSDEFTTRMLYFFAKKVVFTNEDFYYRQNNPNAITKKWNPRLLESFDTAYELENFTKKKSPNKDKDIVKVWETLYNELMRISLIFYKNRKFLSKQEAKEIEKQLKKVYTLNRKKFMDINLYNFKRNKIKSIITLDYFFLKTYCLIRNIF